MCGNQNCKRGTLKTASSDIADPISYAKETALDFKKKADRNKAEALLCFSLVIIATLSVPIFVTLGQGWILARCIPAVLSLFAAASTTWMQLRKPQSLWSLYRDCQRKIEKHITKYEYRLNEYETDQTKRTKFLVTAVSDVAWSAHEHWLDLIPAPEALGAIPTKVDSFEPGRKDI